VCAPAVAPGCTGAGGHPVLTISVALAWGKHLFPFRTEQLSPTAPMVLGLHGPGRVGRRRLLSPSRLRAARVVKPRPGWSTSACSWTASASRFPSTAPVLREIGRPLPVDWEDGLRSALPRGLRRAAPRRWTASSRRSRRSRAADVRRLEQRPRAPAVLDDRGALRAAELEDAGVHAGLPRHEARVTVRRRDPGPTPVDADHREPVRHRRSRHRRAGRQHQPNRTKCHDTCTAGQPPEVRWPGERQRRH
jgi:hypothetical protein